MSRSKPWLSVWSMSHRPRIAPGWVGVGVAVLLAAVMGLLRGHLSVQQMVLGREVQRLGQQIYDLQVEIEALQTALAYRLRYEVLAEKARTLGFRPLAPEKVLYVPVPAPPPRQEIPVRSHRPLLPGVTPSPWARTAYRETLWDWLVRNLWLPGGAP